MQTIITNDYTFKTHLRQESFDVATSAIKVEHFRAKTRRYFSKIKVIINPFNGKNSSSDLIVPSGGSRILVRGVLI